MLIRRTLIIKSLMEGAWYNFQFLSALCRKFVLNLLLIVQVGELTTFQT